jgi:antitoxin ParD1/3/4
MRPGENALSIGPRPSSFAPDAAWRQTRKDMTTPKISISNNQQQWMAAQVAAGWYANASDYIQELIRRDQQASESLRLALINGKRSVSERTVSDVAHQVRQRLRR